MDVLRKNSLDSAEDLNIKNYSKKSSLSIEKIKNESKKVRELIDSVMPQQSNRKKS